MFTIRYILVLCVGNHCRSPIAEAMLRRALGLGVEVHSAGLGALTGSPPHLETQKMAQEFGLNVSAHRGTQVSPEMVRAADLILVMDQTQKEACQSLTPTARGKVFLLGHWLALHEQEIIDPMGRSLETHARVYEHIRRGLELWLPRLVPRIGA